MPGRKHLLHIAVGHSYATRRREILSSVFEKSSYPRAPLRNRTVDLLRTIHNSAGFTARCRVAAQQHPTGRLLPWPAMGTGRYCGETRAVPGRPQGQRSRHVSVPGRSVRSGAGRSRPGRRSDDGQGILLRVQRSLERPAEQVFLYPQANSNPRPYPCLRTTSSHEGDPASRDQPQLGRHRTRRCRARLRRRPAMNSTLRRSVSTSGADNSAGTPARPPLSAAELLAAKNTRPIQSPATSPLTSSSPTRDSRSSWPSPAPSATATSPDPCRAASHPRHRRRLVTPPAQTHWAAGHATDRARTQLTSDSAE